MIVRLALIGVIVATAIAGVQTYRVGKLATENGDLMASVVALEQSVSQAKTAAAVARAAAERERTKADEYDAFREALINGESDENLPDWFRDYINGILGRL